MATATLPKCARCGEPTSIMGPTAHPSDRLCAISLANHLACFTHGLNQEERLVVERVADRLRKGRREHGPWMVNKEIDYTKEITEELLDAIVYLTMQMVSQRHGK